MAAADVFLFPSEPNLPDIKLRTAAPAVVGGVALGVIRLRRVRGTITMRR